MEWVMEKIYNNFQEMGMNITTYKWKNATDKEATTGQLQGLQVLSQIGGKIISQNKI